MATNQQLGEKLTLSVANIRRDLRAEANSEIAEHSKRFFKTGPGEYGAGDRFLGLRVPLLRRVAKSYRELPLKSVIKLLHSKYHEERLTALFILVAKFEKSDSAGKKEIYDLYLENTDQINNWDLVDSSAHQIVGGYLADRSRKPLLKLAKAKCLWLRRISIIATLHFIRLNDYDATLEIAELLLHDDEDLIHKAVGWMLREVGNRHREVELAFLDRFYTEMPRTMLRYAIEKFPAPLRKHYLKK